MSNLIVEFAPRTYLFPARVVMLDSLTRQVVGLPAFSMRSIGAAVEAAADMVNTQKYGVGRHKQSLHDTMSKAGKDRIPNMDPHDDIVTALPKALKKIRHAPNTTLVAGLPMQNAEGELHFFSHHTFLFLQEQETRDKPLNFEMKHGETLRAVTVRLMLNEQSAETLDVETIEMYGLYAGIPDIMTRYHRFVAPLI